jgi:hypothetical protein
MNQFSKFIKSKGLMNSIVVVLLIVPLYVTSVFSIFSYINLRTNSEPEIDMALLDDMLSENIVEEDPFSEDEYQNEELESDNIEILPETGGSITLKSVSGKCVNGKIQATVNYSSEVKGGKFKIQLVSPSKTYDSNPPKTTITFSSDKTNFSINVFNGKIRSKTMSFSIAKCGNTIVKPPQKNTNWLSIKAKFENNTKMIVECWTNDAQTAIHNSDRYAVILKEYRNGVTTTKIFKPWSKDIVHSIHIDVQKDMSIKIIPGDTYSVKCWDVPNNMYTNTVIVKAPGAKPVSTNTPKPTPTKIVIKKPVTPTTYCNISGAQKVCTFVKIERYFVGIAFQYGYKVKVQMAAKAEYICDKYVNTYKISAGQLKSVRIYSNCK